MMFGRLLVRTVAWSCLHPVLVIVGALLLGVLCTVALTRLTVDSSLTAMLGRTSPAADAFAKIAERFDISDDLLVVATAPRTLSDAAATEQLNDFAEDFAALIRGPDGTQAGASGVRSGQDPAFEAYVQEVLVPRAAIWLDDDGFTDLIARLEPESVRNQLERDAAMLAAPGPGTAALARQLMKDPLRLHELLFARAGIAADELGSLELSSDRRTVLLRVSGARPVSDIEFATAFTSSIRRLAGGVADGLEIRIGGGYAIAAEAATRIRRDAIINTVASGLATAVFLVVAFRSFVAPLTILATSTVGITVGWGIYAAFGTSLTPLTAVVAGMLAGLGVDYAVHFRFHFDALRSGGVSAREGCNRTALTMGGALVSAWLTSVFGFGAIGLSDISMLRSFAIIGCMGLIGAMLATWTVLPALLVLTPSSRPSRAVRTRAGPLESLTRWLIEHRRLSLCLGAMLASGALLAAAANPGFLPRFQTDAASLHPQPNEALETTQLVQRQFGGEGDTVLVYVEAPETAGLALRCHEVADRLSGKYGQQAGIRRVFGLSSLTADPREIAGRNSVLTNLDVQAVLTLVRAEFDQSDFDTDAFADYFELLRRLLLNREAPSIEDVSRYPDVGRLFLPKSNGETNPSPREAIMLVTTESKVTAESIAAIRGLLASVPHATLTGMDVVSLDLKHQAKRDLGVLSVVSIILVIGSLCTLLRNALDIALAFVPVVISVLCVLGYLAVRGQSLNVASVVGFPLLAGIAVDSGIFLVASARNARAGSASLLGALGPTVRAISCSTVTTLIGFGSLIWTNTPAIRSLGEVTIAGMLGSLAACLLIVIPALAMRAAPVKQ